MNEEKMNNNQPIGEDFNGDIVENNNDLTQNQETENASASEKSSTENNGGNNFFGNQIERGNKENSNYFGNTFNSGAQGGDFARHNGNYYNGSYMGDGNFNNEQLYDRSNMKKGLGIASLVLGILSILCCTTGIFSLVFSVLAVIFAAIRIKVKSDGFAIAGLVTGILGLIMSVIVIGVFVIEIASSEYYESIESFEVIIKSIVNLIK